MCRCQAQHINNLFEYQLFMQLLGLYLFIDYRATYVYIQLNIILDILAIACLHCRESYIDVREDT